MDLAGVCKDVVYHKNLIKLPQVKKKKKKNVCKIVPLI